MYSYDIKPIRITLANRQGTPCIDVPRERISDVFERLKAEVLTGHINKDGGLDGGGREKLRQLHGQNPRLVVLTAALEEVAQTRAKKEDELSSIRMDLAREREREAPVKKENCRREKKVAKLLDEIRQMVGERAEAAGGEGEALAKTKQMYEDMLEIDAQTRLETEEEPKPEGIGRINRITLSCVRASAALLHNSTGA